MPTKDEIATQAIQKTHDLEVIVAQQQKDIESLKRDCAELRDADKANKDLLNSAKSLRFWFQYAIIPVLVGVAAAAGGGLFWTGRMAQRVETLEQTVTKTADRLESTRDQILVRHEEVTGTFVKTENKRIFIKSPGNEIFDMGINPNTRVEVNGIDGSLSDLKEKMNLWITFARSIDGKPTAIFIRNTDPRAPRPIRELPKPVK